MQSQQIISCQLIIASPVYTAKDDMLQLLKSFSCTTCPSVNTFAAPHACLMSSDQDPLSEIAWDIVPEASCYVSVRIELCVMRQSENNSVICMQTEVFFVARPCLLNANYFQVLPPSSASDTAGSRSLEKLSKSALLKAGRMALQRRE